MSDLADLTLIRGLDTPRAVGNAQPHAFIAATAGDYGVGFASGTFNDCASLFRAPTTGRVMLYWGMQLTSNDSATWTAIAPVVRRGGIIGDGSIILDASDDGALILGPNLERYGMMAELEDLDPGDTYNVRLEHLVSGGSSLMERRYILVKPAT